MLLDLLWQQIVLVKAYIHAKLTDMRGHSYLRIFDGGYFPCYTSAFFDSSNAFELVLAAEEFINS